MGFEVLSLGGLGFEILNSNLILKLGLKNSNFINKTFNKNAIFLFSQGGDTLGVNGDWVSHFAPRVNWVSHFWGEWGLGFTF